MRILVLVVLLLEAACASQRPRVSPRYYEAFYDGYYGPFVDGYWGRDQRYFWYMDANKAWRRDTDHHFQRGESSPIYRLVRGSGAPRSH